MKLPCPVCGERDYAEFHYGGDASKARPDHGAGGLMAWHDHVFLFDNPRGPHTEYWQHALGCRTWFTVKRDTALNRLGAPE